MKITNKKLESLGIVKNGENWMTPDGSTLTRAEAEAMATDLIKKSEHHAPKKAASPEERTRIATAVLASMLGNNELLTAVANFGAEDMKVDLCRQAVDYADTLLAVLAQ